jgi:hypothetical protein
MTDDNGKHAKAQRKHAAKLKKNGIPRSDDLAQALLAALRAVCRDKKLSTTDVVRATVPWLARAVMQLEARDFSRRHAVERLVRTVFPDDPSRGIDGSRIIPGFDLGAITERIDQALLQEDEARRRENEKADA